MSAIEGVIQERAFEANKQKNGMKAGGKGIRELKGLFSSNDYGESSANVEGFDYFSMNLMILSWNVRDLNGKDKRLQIKKLLRTLRVDIVFLQETKLEWITRGLVFGAVLT